MSSTLQLTTVHLRVASLARSLGFYVGQLGFAIIRQAADQAELGTAGDPAPLLVLQEDPQAQPAPADAAGLFHAALLFPQRAALGGWLRHAAEAGVEFDGFSDHGVSEAVYFSDPDGNGLEFYCDRPQEKWPHHEGALAMGTRPLDVPALLAAAGPAPASGLAGARWGHLHLRVTQLDRSEAFYRQLLGLQLTQGSYPGARFLAADGYHHHLGLNSWGRPQRARPENSLGLIEATFAVPPDATLGMHRDPDGISLRLIALDRILPTAS